ncbi:MAG: hypothetical protein K6C11_01870 [Bacilli bacterium]|nr:hypothetical protein [Bacilli bacterium]
MDDIRKKDLVIQELQLENEVLKINLKDYKYKNKKIERKYIDTKNQLDSIILSRSYRLYSRLISVFRRKK